MIRLYVTGQDLKLTTPVVAADSLKYLEAQVHFTDNQWKGASKWLHFRSSEESGANVYDLQLDEDDAITEDRALNLTVGEWTVYLTGVNGNKRLTTVPVILTVKESGLIDAPLHELPMSVAEQLAYKAELALTRINDVQGSAGIHISGFYASLAALQENVPAPYIGEAYAVGSAAPYHVYVFDGLTEQWKDAGELISVRAEGTPGTTFTPSVDSNGNLSWVNDGNKQNPATVNIMGPTGAKGDKGDNGEDAYAAASAQGYVGEAEAFYAMLAMMPSHASRHAAGGPDQVTIGTENLASSSVTAAKIAANAVSRRFTGTLTTAGWTGSAAPYSQELTVSSLLATDTPIIDVTMSGTYATDEKRVEAWSSIYRAVPAAGKLTVYATEKPGVALPIQIICIRK